MSIEMLTPWISAVALMMTIANIAWAWVIQGRSATATKLDEVECVVDEHEKRIQNVESDIRHLPSKEDVAGLKLQIVEVIGTQKATSLEVSSIARTVHRIDDHLRAEVRA